MPHSPHGRKPARFFYGILRGVMGKPEKFIFVRTAGVAVSLSGGSPGTARPTGLPRRIKVLNWGENPNCLGKRVNVGALFVKCLNAETYPSTLLQLNGKFSREVGENS